MQSIKWLIIQKPQNMQGIKKDSNNKRKKK